MDPKSSRGFWENELTVSLTVESSPGVVFAIMFTKPQERYSRAGVKVMLKLASIFRIRPKLLAFCAKYFLSLTPKLPLVVVSLH